MAWDKLGKAHNMPKLVDIRYPFPKDLVDKRFMLPAVDDPLTCLSKERLLPALDGSNITDPVDKRVEQVLGPFMASVWTSRASLSLLEKLKSGIEKGASQDSLFESLALLSDFTRQAALDGIRLVGVTSATSNTARRLIWLKQ